MRLQIMLFILLSIVVFLFSECYAQTANGMPIKYISSCELDLNGDNKSDIALLFESSTGRELVVLLKSDIGYEAHLVSKSHSNMYLACHFGKTIRETAAGKDKKNGKTYQTGGTYLLLFQPEVSSIAYFWEAGKFKEVWTAD